MHRSDQPHLTLARLAVMQALSDSEKRDYRHRHLRHRLTLLRTLRERKKAGYSYPQQGDIYRCVKDGNLIAVRLFMDFLGIRGESTPAGVSLCRAKRRNGKRVDDDVKIDQFIGRLLTPNDVPDVDKRVLAGVYLRANKELAHLTTRFNDEFNQEDALIHAATAIESLLERHLYAPNQEAIPIMDA
jgi:hypothetical protein